MRDGFDTTWNWQGLLAAVALLGAIIGYLHRLLVSLDRMSVQMQRLAEEMTKSNTLQANFEHRLFRLESESQLLGLARQMEEDKE